MDNKGRIKKVIILQHNGDELGSQLWNYASIYAYCIERGHKCYNPSFFEYEHYFKNLKTGSTFVNLLLKTPFSKSKHRRKYSPFVKFFRFIYKIYVNIIRILNKKRSLRIGHDTKYGILYLPPTEENRLVNSLEKNNKVYFDGHLFRTPKGLEKHRNEILHAFSPNKNIQNKVYRKLTTLRNKFDHVVGIHVRQSDYRDFKRGKFFVDQGHTREAIDSFLEKFKIDPEKTVFYIASDQPIESKFFQGLNYVTGSKNPAVDLFTLSGTDVIIGPDSHFGSFASFYGNIPHIVHHRDEIDWKYYKDKNSYFHNKYWKVTKY